MPSAYHGTWSQHVTQAGSAREAEMPSERRRQRIMLWLSSDLAAKTRACFQTAPRESGLTGLHICGRSSAGGCEHARMRACGRAGEGNLRWVWAAGCLGCRGELVGGCCRSKEVQEGPPVMQQQPRHHRQAPCGQARQRCRRPRSSPGARQPTLNRDQHLRLPTMSVLSL